MKSRRSHINLKEYYPECYQKDCWIEVSDAVAQIMEDERCAEMARRRQIFRYRAYYSLDRQDGIERRMLHMEETPFDLLEKEYIQNQIEVTRLRLTLKQSKRIYSRYYLGMSETEIAQMEGVAVASVHESIERGLKRLGKILRRKLYFSHKIPWK